MSGFWRWVRAHWVLSGLAAIVIGTTSLHFGLEWRGEHIWERYAEQSRARGVKLLEAEISLPPIPPEQNFAEIPMLKEGGKAGNPFKFPSDKKGPPNLGNPRKGVPIDWVAWQSYFQRVGWLPEVSADPVADVLRASEHFAPAIEEWRQWRTRPQCRFPTAAKNTVAMLQSNPSALLSANEVFGLRVRAHLAQGNSAEAYTELEDFFQTYRVLENEPCMVNGIMRLGSIGLWVSALGSGLRDHAWQEKELGQIARRLNDIHLRADYEFTMESERRASNDIFDKMLAMPLRKRGENFLQISEPGLLPDFIPPDFAPIAAGLIPRWVYRENQLRTNQLVDAILAKIREAEIELDARLPGPAAAQLAGPKSEKRLVIFELMASAYSGMAKTYQQTQASLQLAKTAVALERAWLARHAYPESLSELVPEYLPTLPVDNFSGRPPIYHRTSERTFVLYSVGENQQDDNGPANPLALTGDSPDIVWPHAPLP